MHVDFSIKPGGNVCVFGCSSAIDQSDVSGVHTAAGRGVDSEADDDEDDEEVVDDDDDDNNSDDSDPELASPHLIRQTHLGLSDIYNTVFLSGLEKSMI